MSKKIDIREVRIALISALVAAVLFCLRQGITSGDFKQSLFLAYFAVPVALIVTVIFELPIFAFLKSLGRVRLIDFIIFPALSVLILAMAPLLLNPSAFIELRFADRLLVVNGRVVWGNFVWMIIYHIEPALWAAFAGCLYWFLLKKPH